MIATVLPELWNVVSIGSLCEPVESEQPSKQGPGSFRYIDISSVDNTTKQITNDQEIENSEAPSRARQIVATNDVIVSTVRPGLNAVAIVPEELDGEICSTGFCVLRAETKLLNPEYLFAWVRHPQFIQSLVRLERGVGYPAVSDSDVKSVKIPLPPLPEQARIVAILRQADELRRLRQQARTKADKLLAAVFHNMFGDPKREWRKSKLGDVFSLEAGKSIVANSNPAQDDKWGVLKVSAVTYGNFLPAENKELPDNVRPIPKFEVKHGDLLISRANTEELVGASAIVRNPPRKLMIPDKLWRVILRRDAIVNMEFLYGLLNTKQVRFEISSRATGTSSSMKNISQTKFLSIEVRIPPKNLQDQYATKAETLRSEVISTLNASADRMEVLFQSTLAEAFSGELTAVYRTQNQAELQEAAAQRDIALSLRNQEPPPIDFEAGRVTPQEADQFRQSVQQVFKPAMQDLLTSLGTSNTFGTLARQMNFSAFAELIRPALPTYNSLVSDILADSLAAIGEGMRLALAGHFTDTMAAAIAPLAKSIQLPSETFYQSLSQSILALAAQARQIVKEPPQPTRAIHAQLDPTTKTTLQAIKALSTYFTPAELHQLLQELGHHFGHNRATDLVQVEAGLQLLEAAGFVRQVNVNERLVYRLIDPVADGALLPTELAG